jgi:uncharacterized protein YqjF (DUF2071 family)
VSASKCPIGVERFTFEECERLIKAADDEWRPMITIAARTGIRFGELLGLEWDDVDLVAGSLVVRHAVARDGAVCGPRHANEIVMTWRPIHPVPMRTIFSTCVLVNFAIDPCALRRRLPAHLEPDLHDDKAYLSIVIARMEKMRPSFVPKALGVTYHQVVYRAVVKRNGERGVTFLRSDADNRLMVAAGNALTFFRFHAADIAWETKARGFSIALQPKNGDDARIRASYTVRDEPDRLPATSRFGDLRSAQAFLSELYVAFGAQRANGRTETVRIARTPWKSHVVADEAGEYSAMTSGVLFARSEAQLDSIFLVEDLAYRWERLSLE